MALYSILKLRRGKTLGSTINSFLPGIYSNNAVNLLLKYSLKIVVSNSNSGIFGLFIIK